MNKLLPYFLNSFIGYILTGKSDSLQAVYIVTIAPYSIYL